MPNRALATFLALAVLAPAMAGSGAGTPASGARRFVTEHTATINDRRIAYTAIAGETVLPDARGNPGAVLFTFSYIAKGKDAGPARPVTFLFNGGPGSSSIWEHIGGLGPRRVAYADDAHPNQTPPFRLQDSEYSLLDASDLVFIDYFGSGFSRLLPGVEEGEFQGVRQDAHAVASFITLWLTEHQRWNSPKYVMGESYGTIRAMAVAEALAGGYLPTDPGHLNGVTLNGVAVLGPYFGADPDAVAGEDRGYLNVLPTMAATAWYHGRIDRQGQSQAQAIQAARDYAAGDYVQALYAGRRLTPEKTAEVAGRLAALTGLPKETWLAHDLRIDAMAFRDLLLPDQQVGAYDARFTLPAFAAGDNVVTDDPGMGPRIAGSVAALNEYFASELGITGMGQYVPLDWKRTFFRWDRGFGGPGIERPWNYLTDFAPVLRRNPEMRFLVGIGAYDLVATIGKAEYDLAHAKIARERTDVRIYGAGHMIYVGAEPSRALAADLRAFVSGRPLPQR